MPNSNGFSKSTSDTSRLHPVPGNPTIYLLSLDQTLIQIRHFYSVLCSLRQPNGCKARTAANKKPEGEAGKGICIWLRPLSLVERTTND